MNFSMMRHWQAGKQEGTRAARLAHRHTGERNSNIAVCLHVLLANTLTGISRFRICSKLSPTNLFAKFRINDDGR